MDRCQACVACPWATIALFLQMMEETKDVRGIPIFERLLGGNAMGPSLLVLKQ
jgi:hypothetical protein